MLGRRVGVGAEAAHHAGGAGHGDDRAGHPGLHHPGGVLDAVEHPVEQHVDAGVPLVGRGGVDGSDRADNAGVVVHHVKLTEFGHRGVHQSGHVVLGGHVAMDVDSGVAQGLGQFPAGVVLDVAYGHSCALFYESLGGGPPDAAGRPGDGRYPSFQSSAHRCLL